MSVLRKYSKKVLNQISMHVSQAHWFHSKLAARKRLHFGILSVQFPILKQLTDRGHKLMYTKGFTMAEHMCGNDVEEIKDSGRRYAEFVRVSYKLLLDFLQQSTCRMTFRYFKLKPHDIFTTVVPYEYITKGNVRPTSVTKLTCIQNLSIVHTDLILCQCCVDCVFGSETVPQFWEAQQSYTVWTQLDRHAVWVLILVIYAIKYEYPRILVVLEQVGLLTVSLLESIHAFDWILRKRRVFMLTHLYKFLLRQHLLKETRCTLRDELDVDSITNLWGMWSLVKSKTHQIQQRNKRSKGVRRTN